MIINVSTQNFGRIRDIFMNDQFILSQKCVTQTYYVVNSYGPEQHLHNFGSFYIPIMHHHTTLPPTSKLSFILYYLNSTQFWTWKRTRRRRKKMKKNKKVYKVTLFSFPFLFHAISGLPSIFLIELLCSTKQTNQRKFIISLLLMGTVSSFPQLPILNVMK